MNNTIAVIDDDPIFHFIIKETAAKAPVRNELLHFYNGISALRFFTEHRANIEQLPYMLLLNIQMPTMGAWEFLERLETLSIEHYKPDIYTVTAEATADIKARSHVNPAINALLTKPIAREKLFELLSG